MSVFVERRFPSIGNTFLKDDTMKVLKRSNSFNHVSWWHLEVVPWASAIMIIIAMIIFISPLFCIGFISMPTFVVILRSTFVVVLRSTFVFIWRPTFVVMSKPRFKASAPSLDHSPNDHLIQIPGNSGKECVKSCFCFLVFFDCLLYALTFLTLECEYSYPEDHLWFHKKLWRPIFGPRPQIFIFPPKNPENNLSQSHCP